MPLPSPSTGSGGSHDAAREASTSPTDALTGQELRSQPLLVHGGGDRVEQPRRARVAGRGRSETDGVGARGPVGGETGDEVGGTTDRTDRLGQLTRYPEIAWVAA